MKVFANTAVSFGDGHWYMVANNGPARLLKPNATSGYVLLSRDGTSKHAHHHFYETIVGPIPTGLVPDHLCRDRACCAPAHIEPVTRSVNALRGRNVNREKTHCPRGHAYAGNNAILRERTKRGNRFVNRTCRVCMNTVWRARRAEGLSG